MTATPDRRGAGTMRTDSGDESNGAGVEKSGGSARGMMPTGEQFREEWRQYSGDGDGPNWGGGWWGVDGAANDKSPTVSCS